MNIMVEQYYRLILAVVLSGIIGLEREWRNKPAGLRTHMLVGLSSALITTSAYSFMGGEYAKVIAGIVTGIGFIGAGNIIAHGSQAVHGLTTASSLWMVAAIGIAVGIGLYSMAIAATTISMVVLLLGKIDQYIHSKK